MEQALIDYLQEKEFYLKHSQINDLFDEWPDTYSGQSLLDPLYDIINFLPYLRNEIPMYFANSSNRLEKVEGLSETILEIGTNAFANCKNLKEVILPSKVDKINDFAFMNCPKLSYVQLPEGLKELGDACFITNSNKLTIDYLGTLEQWIKIDCSADTPPFGESYRLIVKGNSSHIQIPNTIRRIPSYKFTYCDSINLLSVPNTCNFISTGSFECCTELKYAYLYCHSIGDYAFNGCSKLTEITLGAEVRTIKEEAFKNTPLNVINYKGTTEQFKEIVISNDAFDSVVITVKCIDGELTI